MINVDQFSSHGSSSLGKGALQTSSLEQARAAEILSDWRLTPATLMSKLDPSWIPAKWLQYLSFKIATAVARGNCGLLISAPPRHGKSMLSTVATPLWVLENFPDRNVVVSTYGEELSTDFSRQIRDKIQSNQDILSVRLRPDTQRVTNFLTTKGGGLKAVGLRGAITGRGANVFVLDDYIKEPKEAMSATYLEDLWTWWLTVARTRLEPGAVVIILATRWVANDIHGRIMKSQTLRGRNFFEYVALPSIIETEAEALADPIGRKVGDVLFSERYNADSILELKDELGSRWFNAMFQQKPDEDENAAVKVEWFKKISATDFAERQKRALSMGESLQWARCWDMASTKEAGDYTTGALCLWNKVTEEFFIVHMARGQYSPARAELEFVKLAHADYNAHLNYKLGMEQEPGSSGKYSIRHFQSLIRSDLEDGTSGLPIKVWESPATSSKLLNAQPIIAAAEKGNVYVLDDGWSLGMKRDRDAHWNADFYAEIETYPEGAHDDQMDAVSQAYKLLSGKKGLSASLGRNTTVKTPALVDLNGQKLATSGENLAKRRSSVTFGRTLGAYRG